METRPLNQPKKYLKSYGESREPPSGYGSKLNHRGPQVVHVSINFGYLFLTHSQVPTSFAPTFFRPLRLLCPRIEIFLAGAGGPEALRKQPDASEGGAPHGRVAVNCFLGWNSNPGEKKKQLFAWVENKGTPQKAKQHHKGS